MEAVDAFQVYPLVQREVHYHLDHYHLDHCHFHPHHFVLFYTVPMHFVAQIVFYSTRGKSAVKKGRRSTRVYVSKSSSKSSNMGGSVRVGGSVHRARPGLQASRKRSSSSFNTVSSVHNPKTGRLIRVDGPTYRALLDAGFTRAQLQRNGIKRRKKYSRRYSASAGQSHASSSQLSMIRSSASKSSTKSSDVGRGGRTKGCGKAAPSRGRPRRELKKKCGDKCFLDPEHEAFPICASLDSSSTGVKYKNACKIDCRGVQAAKIRAAQWKYKDIERAADELYRKRCAPSGRK
jgi:hypothetical protein